MKNRQPVLPFWPGPGLEDWLYAGALRLPRGFRPDSTGYLALGRRHRLGIRARTLDRHAQQPYVPWIDWLGRLIGNARKAVCQSGTQGYGSGVDLPGPGLGPDAIAAAHTMRVKLKLSTAAFEA